MFSFTGYFFVRDPVANKDLTPKKRDIVETYNLYQYPTVTDIK
jgi:hypothetical protein